MGRSVSWWASGGSIGCPTLGLAVACGRTVLANAKHRTRQHFDTVRFSSQRMLNPVRSERSKSIKPVNIAQRLECGPSRLRHCTAWEMCRERSSMIDRGSPQGISLLRLGTIFLVPIITICWILIFDPRLFGH